MDASSAPGLDRGYNFVAKKGNDMMKPLVDPSTAEALDCLAHSALQIKSLKGKCSFDA